jgi:hypothetical protein
LARRERARRHRPRGWKRHPREREREGVDKVDRWGLLIIESAVYKRLKLQI